MQPAKRDAGDDDATIPRDVEEPIDVGDPRVERARGIGRAFDVAEREGAHAMVDAQLGNGRRHPFPPALDAGDQHDWRALAAFDRRGVGAIRPWGARGDRQLRSVFPLFSVYPMRSSVLRSPQSLRKASRSRSSK